MEDYTFKEKVLDWIKKHRKNATRDSLIALAVVILIIAVDSLLINPEAPETTRPDNVEYRMSMIGDIMMGRHVQDAARYQGEPISRVFNYVYPYFHDSDYTTANFEAAIMDPDDPVVENEIDEWALENKDIHLYAKPDTLTAMEEAGINSISLANNHTMDYGDLSLEQTLEHVKNSNVDFVGLGEVRGGAGSALGDTDEDSGFQGEEGTESEESVTEEGVPAGEDTAEEDSGTGEASPGEDETDLTDQELEDPIEAARISYFEMGDGLTGALIGFTEVRVVGFDANDHVGGVFSFFDGGDAVLRDRLAEANENADVVFVHVHWGDEYQVGYNDDQRRLAQLMVNYGADVIIGHHSHVLEPVTIIEGTEGNRAVVMNSLGNFIFDQGWSRTKETVIAQLDFLEDGSKELSFVPIRLLDSQPRETSGITKPYRNFRIFRTLRKELDENLWRVENDRLIIDLDAAGVLEGVEL
ncbi:CapA family protein [Evansella sp. LMS18]|uniref:CapA family protein n=1 Tax=Evansella sp. LMS18 TaxID=2924033 RepID=UPI0020D1B193|nr:CapA family protein [Evansella sp. LMS18]UTR08632.1 CapA family protein [Evansella sp. LMS18]